MFSSKDLFFTPAAGGFTVNKSLRFRRSATAYLNRTPSGVGTSRRIFTVSFWVKRGEFSTRQAVFSAGAVSTTPSGAMYFNTTNVFEIIGGGGAQYQLTTTQVFRDPSAWYHIVVAFDTTQGTSSNRIKLYVNGSQVTAFSTATYPSLNFDTDYGNSVLTAIGSRTDDGTPPVSTLDGYMAEFNYIDGQALTPSSFGAYDTNGVWQPAAYTGTYGTNGFYLKFTDVGSTTSGGANTGYGKDFAGTNNWTTNNFGTTSTATTYDSMLDSPTNATGDIGNYAVLNPLDKGLGVSVADGNLSGTFGVGSVYYGILCGSMGVNSGKWYWEAQITTNGGSAGQAPLIGITDINTSITSSAPVNTSTGVFDAKTFGYYGATGAKRSSAGNVAYGATFTTGNIIGVALDMDAGTLTFYKDNVSQGTAFSSGISGNTMTPALIDVATGGTDAINFGQRPFTYTPPSGYSPLCTQNLTTPTITNGAQYMAAVTYTGNGGTQTVTTTSSNSGNNPLGTTFQPDLVWTKSRSNAYYNYLNNSVVGAGYALTSNATDAEYNGTANFTAFNSSGFNLAGGINAYNANAATYVAWQWKAGGTGVSNTSGSITSTVSANTTAGFSVVTYTNAATSGTVGHGLGVTPSMIILKGRGPTAANWTVFHTALANMTTAYLGLNTTNAVGTLGSGVSAPTSTTFGTNSSAIPASESSVAYCFAPVAGYSAFGSYTGNGSTDGPFVYTGFRPRFVMTKATTAIAGNWVIIDTSRLTYNQNGTALYPNLSNAEVTTVYIDILSNGFKIRNNSTNQNNTSSDTYIWAAFAENPFKISRAV